MSKFGPPTLFLTFSCAEYQSANYLGQINDVNYPIGRLYTEYSISVSRWFLLKFHSFLLNSMALGRLFFLKYQGRGVPLYHLLYQIENAPVIGVNSDYNIINERIMCHIPNKDTFLN